MSDAPLVLICPPMRCHQAIGGRPRLWCGDPASWQRPGNAMFPTAYFCEAHHQSSDIPLPAELTFRRVRVQLDVILCGTSAARGEAQAEAVARLEAAIAALGGVVSLQTVSSAWVRARPQAHAGGENAGGVDGEVPPPRH